MVYRRRKRWLFSSVKPIGHITDRLLISYVKSYMIVCVFGFTIDILLYRSLLFVPDDQRSWWE
ncbi:hypothetical protein KBB05_03740, partial [Patescibacteria group bacterium]|nr:hypothetical protein [Patescibacteria group bacterium]